MAVDEGYKSITGLLDRPSAPTATGKHLDGLYRGVQRCALCGRVLAGKYAMMNAKIACVPCAAGQTAALARRAAESRAAFLRGLRFGSVAAAFGLVLYASFTIVTHIYLGYAALAVGWLVGTAMMEGSGGVGGPRYQAAAVLLTYAAISLASIPIFIAAAIRHGSATIAWGSAIGRLILWGIASPSLDLKSGPMGYVALLILFVGLRIAYRTTRAVPVAADAMIR